MTDEATLRSVAARLERESRIGVDVESNGLFRYRATLCTVQIAPETATEDVVVVDTLAIRDPRALARLLGPEGPRKIVHDVAFDARILAEAGLPLGNVFDTSIAARMLGRTSTGLAALLAEVGITLDKKLQHHDWTERPIRGPQLRYLADDVVHLRMLADRLAEEIRAKEIDAEVEEETRYRVRQATEAAGTTDPRPPYLRLKGIDRVAREELPILRRIAAAREDKARNLDVPPYKVLGPDILFAIAHARPTTFAELEKVKGATSGSRARALANAILEGVREGVREHGIPEEDQRLLERPKPPPNVLKARRVRENRLTSWRRAEAKRREVDEQVVLPGHCLQDLADMALLPGPDEDGERALAAIPGIGAFRVERYGAAILEVLRRGEDAGGKEPAA